MSELIGIERMVYGGGGVPGGEAGAAAGITVPFTLPGELVRIGGAAVTTAADVAVVEPSPERVVPRCRHFGVCGGCQYQHAGYGEQLRIKEGILRGLLEGAGLRDLPPIAVHSGEPWGYRNRVRMRVAVEADGHVELGYSSRVLRDRVPEFLPIAECPIAAPVLWRGAVAFRRALAGVVQAGGAWWSGTVAEVEFFATGDESRLQMTLFLRGAGRGTPAAGERELAVLCEAMRGELPELAGAGLVALPPERPGAGSRVAQRGRPVAAWGAPGLPYGAGGRSYWVSRGGFFQVNRFLIDELLRLVTAGRGGARAWDLYAGGGLFSRALGESFGEVVAVESGEVAAADLVAGTRGGNVRAVRAGVPEFLGAAVLERDRPELVVMDPPRAGVGVEVARLLGRVRTREMVYVSCDPTTLSRDLRAMVDSGYNLAELHLVDLFPQTFHMETVVALRRR